MIYVSPWVVERDTNGVIAYNRYAIGLHSCHLYAQIWFNAETDKWEDSVGVVVGKSHKTRREAAAYVQRHINAMCRKTNKMVACTKKQFETVKLLA